LDRPPSVIYGTDCDVLKVLLALHAPPSPRVLDTTFGRGVMWKKVDVRPWRNDIAPDLEADSHYDFRRLPAEWADRFDVVVFDPPHITEVGANARLASGNPYGLRDLNGHALAEVDVAHLFPAFLREAQRVLRPGGIVLAKVKDGVHRSRFRWLSYDFKVAAEQIGMTMCAPIIKVDPHAGRIQGANWTQVDHPRTVHTWWLTVHNGELCVARKNRRASRAVPSLAHQADAKTNRTVPSRPRLDKAI